MVIPDIGFTTLITQKIPLISLLSFLSFSIFASPLFSLFALLLPPQSLSLFFLFFSIFQISYFPQDQNFMFFPYFLLFFPSPLLFFHILDIATLGSILDSQLS